MSGDPQDNFLSPIKLYDPPVQGSPKERSQESRNYNQIHSAYKCFPYFPLETFLISLGNLTEISQIAVKLWNSGLSECKWGQLFPECKFFPIIVDQHLEGQNERMAEVLSLKSSTSL